MNPTERRNRIDGSKEPLRVLNVYSGNFYGGVETLLVTFARNRALSKGIEWGFALCFEGRLAEELRAAGARVIPLGPARLSRPWTVQRVRRRLEETLRSGDWDVVICHSFWPHVIFAPTVRRVGIPLVFWAHGPQDKRGWLEWWSRRFPPDLVVANSRATQTEVARDIFLASRTEVFYCPVSPPMLQSPDEIRARVRGQWTTSNDAVVIVTSCRLEPWKGHSYLLESLGKIKDVPSWIWWVTNSPQTSAQEAYLAGLRTRITELGLEDRVRFLGQVPDVPEVLASADIHCQPNTGPEPFGAAFVEALYAGLRVVTTALGGALEIVDESCGVLIPAGQGDELAATLKNLIEDADRRQRLGRGGPVRAARLCDPAARLNDLTRMLRTTCLEHDGSRAGAR